MKKVLARVFIAGTMFWLAPALPLTSSANAQSVTIDRDGVRLDRRSHRVSRSEAVRIAKRNGMSRVRNTDLRGRYWVVTGESRRRRDILRLTIDARTGRVVGRRYIHR
jgi:hypothetical protein